MALTIVTGMWGPKRDAYAAAFLAAFDAHWPTDVGLHIFSDPPDPAFGAAVAAKMTAGRRTRVSWLKHTDGWDAFMRRHGADKRTWGREMHFPKPWKPSAVRAGYNFRFDACRFAGQAFAPEEAAKDMDDGDVLCWLDADVIAHAQVPAGFIEKLVGIYDGAYLGRGQKHSEIGFWAVELNDRTRAMIRRFADLYRFDALFGLKEWHSAFAWDHARCETPTADMHDLTPDGHGHVFDEQSPLRRYLSHRKGARKGFAVA